MFEQLGLEGWTPISASVVFGLAIGLVFGVLAQRSRFCLRRGLTGDQHERAAALGTWLFALAVGIAGTATLTTLELVSFAEHRFDASSLPAGAIIIGGLLFGAGMYLARGCASRLTVLAGTGNLRAATVIIIFAITAHATLKGAIAPARVWLTSFTVDLNGFATLGALPGGALLWSAVAVVALLAVAARSGASLHDLALGGLIGTLVPIGWLGTGYVLADEFNPITHESLAFTSAASETLFWWVASTAITPGFGVGVFGGVLAGSLLAAVFFGEFKWIGFTSNTQVTTGHYLSGGILMGVGGVLAGGCTVGAGLSGVATLSVSAILALVSIATGALVAQGIAQYTPTAALQMHAE